MDDNNNESKSNPDNLERLLILLSFIAIGMSIIVYGFKIATDPRSQWIFYILGLSMIILGMGSWKYKWIELG